MRKRDPWPDKLQAVKTGTLSAAWQDRSEEDCSGLFPARWREDFMPITLQTLAQFRTGPGELQRGNRKESRAWAGCSRSKLPWPIPCFGLAPWLHGNVLILRPFHTGKSSQSLWRQHLMEAPLPRAP